jgi:hypothetical protein
VRTRLKNIFVFEIKDDCVERLEKDDDWVKIISSCILQIHMNAIIPYTC